GADVQLAEFGEGHLGDRTLGNRGGDAFGRLVVKADDLPVTGEVEVPLDAIRVLLPRQPERRQRVFRRIVRGPAVGNDQLRETDVCGGGQNDDGHSTPGDDTHEREPRG